MAYKRELALPVSVRLPRETKATLEQLAEERHMELSPFIVVVVEDWLKMQKDLGGTAGNRHMDINNPEYQAAMKELIRNTFLDTVINTPNYRDNIKDVVRKVLSEASDEAGQPQTRRKK